MRRYEAMFIVDADLDEDQIQRILDRYSKIITDGGGSILYSGRWEQGRRKLAYDVARRREGMYLIIQFDSNAAVPKEMDRIFRISDDVFRHMIVLQNEAIPLLTQVSSEPAVVESAPAEEPTETTEPTTEEPVAEAEAETAVEAEAAPEEDTAAEEPVVAAAATDVESETEAQTADEEAAEPAAV